MIDPKYIVAAGPGIVIANLPTIVPPEQMLPLGKMLHLAGAFGGEQQTEVRQEVVQQEQPAAEPPPDPVEAPDNLRSASFARIIDILGEGQIEGLVDRSGRVLTDPAHFGKAIYIDETPLMNSDGKPNFQGFKVGMTWGTADQAVIAGFGAAGEVLYSGVPVRFNLPVSVGITNANTERIEVAVRINALLSQDVKTGNINGSAITYRVDCSLNSGPFAALQVVTKRGKTRSPYLSTTSHTLPRSMDPDNDQWTIRVVRISPDAANLTVSNDISFDFVTCFSKHQFRYTYSAYIAAEVNAKGFTGIPNRAYRVRGILIRVPNNYFPDSRLYNRDPMTGDPVETEEGDPIEQIWNGGFYTVWSDNPAWCFFDLMTNRRYGLGEYMGVTDSNPDGQVDKWSLYPVAKYCDGLVNNGFGIMEPRFTCNLVIGSREEAWKVMNDMASVFRGILYWNQGVIVAVQDRPNNVLAGHFTNANVVDGMFSYSGTALKARHTSFNVRWNDPGDFYRPKFEIVEDADAIARYGYRPTELAAFGCTSRGQAHRMGKASLLSETLLTDTVSFKGGMECAYLRPGDIIDILDNDRAGVQQGGRLVGIAADRLSVTLDRSVTLHAGANTVTFTRPQPFVGPADIEDSSEVASLRTSQVYTATITTGAGATMTLAFGVALPEGVEVPAVFLVTTSAVVPAEYRVLSIEEMGDGQYGVSALQYNADLFEAVENGVTLDEPDISDLPTKITEVLEPVNITLTRAPAITEGNVVLKILASWEAPPDASIASYVVEYRLDSGNWVTVEETGGTSSEIVYQVAGTYQVKVTSINGIGARSDGIITQIVIPNTNPIELVRIVGLELIDGANAETFQGRDAKFSWRLISPTTNAEPGQGPGNEGFTDPYFSAFEVTIWRIAGGDLQVWRETTTAPEFVFTFEKNLEVGPFNQFRIEVRALDAFANASPSAKLTVSNPPPAAPTSPSAAFAWRTVAVDWLNPADIDLVGIEIYMGTTNVFADAGLLATVAGSPGARGTFVRSGMAAGLALWFWLKAIDSFGNRSEQVPSAGLAGVMASIEASDIANFAVTATKLFTNAIILTGDVWTDSPGAGRIAWNAHTVVFRGAAYAIAAGDTPATHQYVWWRGPIIDPDDGSIVTAAENVYRTSITHPKDDAAMLENDFIIATNAEAAGLHDLAWRGFANAVIGSAYIRSAAIQDAHIDNVSADKITAGLIVGHEITLVDAMGSPSILKSNNYVAGESGWAIFGDGTAEFNDVRIRGALDLGIGYENGDYPGQLFLARPVLTKFIADLDFGASVPAGKTYVTDVNTVADPQQAIDGIRRDNHHEYSTAGQVQYSKVVMGGFSGGTAPGNRINQDDLVFTGIALTSTLVAGTGGGLAPDFWNMGTVENGVMYRRLGRAGINTFHIRAQGEAVKWFSIYFMIVDPPAANANAWAPFGDTGYPWQRLGTVPTNGSASRLSISYSRLFKILVPDNKCIIFGISPMDSAGTTGNDVIYDLGIEVTALNNDLVAF